MPDDPGEPATRTGLTWVSAAIPLCIGIAILAVGLAVSLRLLMDTDGSEESDSGSGPAVTAASTTSIDPLSLLPRAPTSVGETTTAAPTTATPTTAPGGASLPEPAGDPSLVPLPVVGGAAAAPATVPTPTTGTVTVHIFNGFSPGTPLEVWDVASGTPVKYGTVPYAGLAGMVAGGRLLPSGVELNLRFVRPGGDPMAPRSATGPWAWDFTPRDGSSQTLMLSDNEGFRIVRIDNLRAAGAVPPGQVHVVPVVFHLLLENTRTKRWAADGVGCLGHLTTDKAEFDVPVGTALRLTSADDETCTHSVGGPVVVSPSGAIAVVGVELSSGTAQLIAVPLG